MPETRETHIERDEHGRVVDTKVRVSRHRGAGFGWGLLFGALVLAVVVIAFAYSQGSFQQAGVEADQAAAQAERQLDAAVDQTGDAIDNAAERTEEAANEVSDTATN